MLVEVSTDALQDELARRTHVAKCEAIGNQLAIRLWAVLECVVEKKGNEFDRRHALGNVIAEAIAFLKE